MVPNMIKGLHHVSITVNNLENALKFYRDLLGLTVLYMTEGSGEQTAKGVGVAGAELKIAVVQAGEGIIELIEYVTPKGRVKDTRPCDTGTMHLAFSVKDVQKAYLELSAKGVKFNSPPNEITEGPMKGWVWTHFKDFDGSVLELVEMRK
jgi:catechol 2,3-dioxygenase-like lactoylglutathione lyase family enzyme